MCGRGVPPWGFRGPTGRRPTKAKTPSETAKNLTEVTKSMQKPTKKARQGSRGHSDHLSPPEKGPLWLSGAPATAKVIISDPSEYQGASQLSGALWISGALCSSGTFWSSGPLWLKGALPTSGALWISGALMGRFKPGTVKILTFCFYYYF